MRIEAASARARTIGRRHFLAQGSVVLIGASGVLDAFGNQVDASSIRRSRDQPWPRARRASRWPRHVQRHPVRGLRLGSQPLQSRATAAILDGCTRRLAVGRSVVATGQSTERAFTRGGLPLPERLDASRRRTQAPRDVLQPRRWVHDRLRWSRLSGWQQPGAHVGCRRGRHKPQARSHGLSVPRSPGW